MNLGSFDMNLTCPPHVQVLVILIRAFWTRLKGFYCRDEGSFDTTFGSFQYDRTLLQSKRDL